MLTYYTGVGVRNFLEPAMFCHLALWRGKRPKVHVENKGFKNFFRLCGGRGSKKPKKVLT